MNWIERLLALGLLLILSPLFVAICIATFLFQGRPIFFLQERVGQFSKPFFIIKFRTMRTDNAGSKVTAGNDPRITPLGRFLRKTRLDEIPQLINIIKGEMAFVGPRPEVPKYAKHYSDEEKKVLDWLPGITDYASLAFRDEERLMDLAKDPERFYVEEVLPVKAKINLKHSASKKWWTPWWVALKSLLVMAKIQDTPYQEELAMLEDKARGISSD